MIIDSSGGGGSGNGGGGAGTGLPNDTSFALSGNFQPYYQPDRLRIKKARNLDRKESFCGGEDVSDNGSKNREIHTSGILLDRNTATFDSLVENNQPMDMITKGWCGQVRVNDGEYEGPVGWDPVEKELQWRYTLNLVSTGVDENQRPPDYGIISG